MQSQKGQNDLSSFPRQTIQYPVIQVYVPTTDAKEAEVEQFYEDLKDLLEPTPNKDVLFITGVWNAKVGSQEIPGITGKYGLRIKWSSAKANKVLPREHTGHSKHSLPTTQEMTLHMDITRWSIPKSDWLYSLQLKMDKLYSRQKTRPGADCGSDQLLITKFRLNLKKVGKTTRPLRYDLNQILYDFTVEVTNRFKGWDLRQSAWSTMMEVCNTAEGGDKNNPQEKEMQKTKMAVWGGLTNSWEKKKSEG